MEGVQNYGNDDDEVEVPEHLTEFVEQNRRKVRCANCWKIVADRRDGLVQGEKLYCSTECRWTQEFGGCTVKSKKPNDNRKGSNLKARPSVMERNKLNFASPNTGVNGDRNAMYQYHIMIGTSLMQCSEQDKAR